MRRVVVRGQPISAGSGYAAGVVTGQYLSTDDGFPKAPSGGARAGVSGREPQLSDLLMEPGRRRIRPIHRFSN